MIDFLLGVVIGWCIFIIQSAIKESADNMNREQEDDDGQTTHF